jgi:antitoxin HicB
MLQYPVHLEREGRRVLVSFPDFPGVHTYGEDEGEALERAVDALETYLMAVIEDREEIPEPRRRSARGKAITLPVLTEAKLALYREMRAANVGKAELARRLHCHLPQIDRLLDLGHASRLDQLEAALLAVGKRLAIHLEDAAA